MSGGRGEEEEEEGGGGGGRQRSVCRPIIIKVIKVIIIKIHAIVRTHALATGTLAHTGMSECIQNTFKTFNKALSLSLSLSLIQNTF